jgi:uncharacterized circularly permuted ATP-grasp superfamily protein
MNTNYEPPPGVYDEAFEEVQRPRPHYLPLLDSFSGHDLGAMAAELKAGLRRAGVTFGASADGLLFLDLVPRLVTAEEWAYLRPGIAQRARALERFVRDVYGERAIVAAGVIPERVIEEAAHYEPAMRAPEPPRTWVSIAGFDLVRGPDGRFRVLEDQIRMPSGIAYAVAARDALAEVLPVEAPSSAGIAAAFEILGDALRDAALPGDGDPQIVLLCEGRGDAGWYEHERIGRELDIPVVTAEQMQRLGDELYVRIGERPSRVDVVYQRTAEDRFTDEHGRPTRIGELLLDPCRAGSVACVNAPGSGVGDDKLVHAYVEDMVRFYLDEEPVLDSVRTYDLGTEEERRLAAGEKDEFVFKPRGKMGGEGVVVWDEADAAERGSVRRALKSSPEDVVAQRRVELSSHPTVCRGKLEPRHVDLRPYVIRTREREWVLPGGLTRFAAERGSLVVNSSQGGGVKDTWVGSTQDGSKRGAEEKA